jgi:hypothetical protein
MKDDWRIRIEVEEERHATTLLERLGLDLGSESQELARALEGHRLAVSREGNELFVYAASRLQARQALRVVESVLAEDDVAAKTSQIEQWLDDEERWSGEPPQKTWEEEEVERGYAPWEVRIQCESHHAASELADQLEADGYGVVRRFHYVIAGTTSEEVARELARRVHGEVEPGGELVWEVAPSNPFAVFGGMGG